MKINCNNPEAVAKRVLYLAWKACRGPKGSGWLQDRPDATEDDVWSNVFTGGLGGDYSSMEGVAGIDSNRPGNVYADYVFGRMMKLGVEWDAEGVIVSDSRPRADYQAWCVTYPTNESLVNAAIEELNKD